LVNLAEIVRAQLRQSLELHSQLLDQQDLIATLAEWGSLCAQSLQEGGTIFFAGNGGSFADAQHMAAELTGKMGRPRKSLRGVVLGANNSSVSAIGNDFGFEQVFSRELEGLYSPSSLVVAFSTSGNSRNITELAKMAKKVGAPMVCLTGDKKGTIGSYCQTMSVPSSRTERIQEMHTLLGHTLCLLIEEELGLSDEPYDI